MIATLLPPQPSKVTATNERSDQVAVIERDGLRLGTSADAGALCGKDGVSGDTYRWYVRVYGAPGPYKIPHPITGKMVSARDEQGRELFNLDAVAKWDSGRPGQGVRVQPGRPIKFTQLRWDLLAGARDGRLHLRDGRPHLGDEPLAARSLQRLGELLDAGLLDAPPEDSTKRSPYPLTDAGRRWLEDPSVLAAKDRAEQSSP